MDRIFFYGIIIISWIVFLLVIRERRLKMRYLFLWAAYSLFSLTYEVLFGEILNLYYYISPEKSLLYILLASYFLYPLIAVVYAIYLPEIKRSLLYTCGWIVFVLLLELGSIYTKTIVLTGWRIIPWSIITYVLTFWLIKLFDNLMKVYLPDTA